MIYFVIILYHFAMLYVHYIYKYDFAYDEQKIIYILKTIDYCDRNNIKLTSHFFELIIYNSDSDISVAFFSHTCTLLQCNTYVIITTYVIIYPKYKIKNTLSDKGRMDGIFGFAYWIIKCNNLLVKM